MDWCDILREFHEELIKYNVLEEVDEECLDSVVIKRSNHKYSILLGSSVIVAPIATVYCLCKGSYWSILSASVSIGAASLVMHQVLLKRRFNTFVNRLMESQRCAREALKRINKRELIAASLNLSALARVRWRHECLCEFRSLIRITSSWTAHLIRDMNLDTEVNHQLSNFYSDEMKSLLLEDDDTFGNDRSLLTLIDLFTLHRSELARVVMLSLVNTSRLNDKILLSSGISKINDSLKNVISRINEICVLRKESLELEKNIQRQTFLPQVDGLQNIAIALSDLSQSICENKSSVDEVEHVLHRIQGMLSLYRSSKVDDVPIATSTRITNITEEDKPKTAEVVAHFVRPVDDDQMFETVAVATHDKLDEDDDYYDWASPKGDLSLMSELKLALCDKSVEFSKRERRALAEFYGVSEEEIKDREEKEKNEKEQKSSDTNELCSLGEGGEGASEWSRPPAPAFAALPSELLNALASRRNASEDCIGDSDEDFE